MESKRSRERQWQFYARQTRASKSRAANRLQVIQRIELLVEAGVTKSRAVIKIADLEKVGASTIWTWLNAIKGIGRHDWLAFLSPGFRGGGRRADVDHGLFRALKADYLRPERPTWPECVRRLDERAKQYEITLPHPRTLWRRLRKECSRLEIARLRGEELPPWLDARYPANDR